jgi:hypothetical protein
MGAEARATTRKPAAARQQAGTPAPPPATEPATALITSLGDPGQDTAAQLAALQAQVAQLQAQQAAAPAAPRAEVARPAGPEAPDILGIPGLKPLVLTTPEDGDKPPGRHPLVYIDGEPITVPDEVSQSVTLEYMHRAGGGREIDLLAAQDYLLTAMLGEDGYARLRAYKHLTTEQLAWVLNTCNRIAIGALEIPKA